MSTRCIIAQETAGGWEGRYCHFDGYPKGIGVTLYNAFDGHFGRDLQALQKFLIDDHPAGWSGLVDCDFSKKPGYTDDTDDDRPRCYCHGQRREQATLFTQRSHLRGMEWLYILRAVNDTPCMDVYELRWPDGVDPWQEEVQKQKIHRARVVLTAPPPDWEKVAYSRVERATPPDWTDPPEAWSKYAEEVTLQLFV